LVTPQDSNGALAGKSPTGSFLLMTAVEVIDEIKALPPLEKAKVIDFVQGFLRINGVIVPDATADHHAGMIAIAERRLGKSDLAALFRRLAS
jgi:hypothetical protein